MSKIKYVEMTDHKVEKFIRKKMPLYNVSIYTQNEMDIYFDNPHINVVGLDEDGKILAFCCLLVIDNGYKMCYTYADTDGKRAYAKGIDYVIARYTPMFFSQGAMKFNKIKRITDVKEH